VIVEHDLDAVAIYRRERESFVELFVGLGDDDLRAPVPATPAWSVGDVLRHVTGITADLNAGDFGGGGDPDAWTAAQVARRCDRTVSELASEWSAEAPRFEEGLGIFGYELASHYVGDLLHHRFDVDAALGRASSPAVDALVVGLDFYLDSLHQRLVAAGRAVGAVRVDVGDERFVVGSGEASVGLRADRFELFRALGGRRSLGQLRSMGWTGDPSRVLELLSPYGFAAHDLAESSAPAAG
jgi:uncharacterized protein (TIGR03083 family)